MKEKLSNNHRLEETKEKKQLSAMQENELALGKEKKHKQKNQ